MRDAYTVVLYIYLELSVNPNENSSENSDDIYIGNWKI